MTARNSRRWYRDRSLLIGLNSPLSGSRGAEAAQWASEIKSVGLSLISRIEMLQTSRPRLQDIRMPDPLDRGSGIRM